MPVNETQLEELDPRLRGEDNKSKCSVIPAQAGIQDIYGKLIVLAEFGIEPQKIKNYLKMDCYYSVVF